MVRGTDDLPDDVTQLQALLRAERARTAKIDEELAAIRAETAAYKAQIEHLKAQLAKLRRSQFGKSSEKLDQQIAQLELVLEDLEESAAQDAAKDAAAESSDQTRPAKRRKPAVRQPLPEHLPRETVELAPEIACSCCQPELTRIGEDVTEVLETIPVQLKVIRYVRPKLACRACQTVFQAPSPDLPISKGRPGPGLTAQVVMSKYGDGLPLYRQSEIFAWQGFEIDRQVLADWMGHAGLFGDWRLGRVVDIEEVAAGMGHAGNPGDRRRLVALGSVQALITGIGVGVQEALVSGEVIARPLALAIRAIAIECRRRSVSGPWSLVDDVGP